VLRTAGVGRLIDVRRYPGSRRHPHMSEEALRRSLPDLGVAYEWWGDDLGGRRKKRADGPTRHPAWRVDAFRNYADHTDTPQFRDAVVRLEDTAAGAPLAVMCAETLWWRCHRRLIADALVVRGDDVVHLLDVHARQPHRLPPTLRVGDDGWPVYDVGADVALFD
jgi:uncharacterized protein (DUF488 family)